MAPARITIPTISTISIALAFWLTALGVAPAANLYVAPAPVGSDAGECTNAAPCATLARACRFARELPGIVSIAVAPGTYSSGCSAEYHRLVFIFGDCDNRPEIVLSGNDFAFSAQDHAILAVRCVNVRSLGNGSIAFIARQFAVMDVNHVRIGPLAQGIGMSAQEMSKINCAAPLEISGGAAMAVAVGDKSTVSLNCAVTFTGTPSFDAFARVERGGLLDAGSASYSGAMVGQKYICDLGEIVGSAAIPGVGQTTNVKCHAH
jgi:hypothetical protein